MKPKRRKDANQPKPDELDPSDSSELLSNPGPAPPNFEVVVVQEYVAPVAKVLVYVLVVLEFVAFVVVLVVVMGGIV